MNDIIAKNIFFIISENIIEDENIDLLRKYNGGWIATILLTNNPLKF